jgi:hypothetical protein
VSRHSRRGLKSFLDDHPLPSLVGLGISVATVVAGVMTYYTSQRLDAAETRHKAELIDLGAKNKTDLFEATTPLKQTIADLTFRISSIERRIPGAGPVYLDVSTISVGPETIKALSSKYRNFDGGEFYVAIPEMGNWSYVETTEWEFLSSIYGFLADPDVRAQVRAQFGDSKLHLWRGRSETKFQTKTPSMGDVTFTFFPAVTVQKITAELVRTRLAGWSDLGDRRETPVKELAKSVDQLHKEISVGSENKEKAVNDEAADAEQAVKAAADKQAILEKLNSAYSTDSGSFTLTDFLAATMVQTTTLGVVHSIYSAQKKGNVFYLQDRMTFRNARIYDGDKLREAGERIAVDQEVFYFGSGADGYLVKIFLPPVPDRADAFSWIKSWLSGFQIPLG